MFFFKISDSSKKDCFVLIFDFSIKDRANIGAIIAIMVVITPIATATEKSYRMDEVYR